MHARTLWVGPGEVAIRDEGLDPPGPDEVLVRTRFSAVSRGTESLVLRGGVPPSEYDRMRAPFQRGDFPGPVAYGYLNVGVVEQGPPDLVDATVFTLFPHQDRFCVPATAVTVVPADVPAGRAVLAGTVETAVNALWDAAPLLGDRIAVVGAGMVGCAVARLAQAIPGARVQLVDVDPARAEVAAALGVEFSLPRTAHGECDLVLHASGTGAGLAQALDLLRTDATVIDLSWYGDTEVTLPLGAAYHARRLTLRSSQVGTIAPHRALSRTHADRIGLALELLRDPVFDVLVSGECRFDELPAVLPGIADGTVNALCHRVVYPPYE